MSKSIDLQNFKSKVKTLVRYDDLDTLGHVNNKTYLSYLEESRIAYMEDVMGFERKSLDFNVVVGRIDIKYLSAIYFGDEVCTYTRISRIGEKSYDFDCWIMKQNKMGQFPSAFAKVTMVTVDQKTGKSAPNTKEMVDAVLKFEIQMPEMLANK